MSDDSQEPIAPGETTAMAVVFAIYVFILVAGIAAAIVIGLAHH